VGGGELVEDGGHRGGRRDGRAVERDRDIEGVDDGVVERTGCATPWGLPGVQGWGSELVEEVGDGQLGIPCGHRVGQDREAAAGRRHLGPELFGG
jgi:hypothetical protein